MVMMMVCVMSGIHCNKLANNCCNYAAPLAALTSIVSPSSSSCTRQQSTPHYQLVTSYVIEMQIFGSNPSADCTHLQCLFALIPSFGSNIYNNSLKRFDLPLWWRSIDDSHHPQWWRASLLQFSLLLLSEWVSAWVREFVSSWKSEWESAWESAWESERVREWESERVKECKMRDERWESERVESYE